MQDRSRTDEEFFFDLMRIMAENDRRRHWSLQALTGIELQEFTKILKTNWKKIVGEQLSEVTRPLAITGKKSRRLIVLASQEYSPPWGTWDSAEKNPKAFREFRQSINNAINPHFVDHVEFINRLSDLKCK